MKELLNAEVVGFFILLLLQAVWGIRGVLTEKRFALFPVICIDLIMLTAGIDSYLASPYLFGLILLILGIVIFSIMTYSLLRLVYKLSFASK